MKTIFLVRVNLYSKGKTGEGEPIYVDRVTGKSYHKVEDLTGNFYRKSLFVFSYPRKKRR